MDWANATLRSTRLNVFVCPTDPNNGPAKCSSPASDVANFPSFTPMDQRTGTPLLNWARGNYGAIQGATDADHVVNGTDGETSDPFPGMPKTGMMGANFGVRIAEVTDGLSNTAAIGELRVGLATIDIRGTWAMGFAGASLCGHAKTYNPTPNNKLGSSIPSARTAATRSRTCPPSARSSPTPPRMGMGFNCGAGMFNSGGQVRSMHPGGVNVGFGDGSVRFIKNSVANQIWFALLVSKDGTVLSADQY